MDEGVSKTKVAERLFTRPDGATMQEVIAATGGPQYNKLKQLEGRGYAIRKVKDKATNETRYFAVAPASPSFVAAMTSKGQVTVPKEVREQLRLRSGQKVEFVMESGDRVVMKPVAARLSDLAGILPKPKRIVSLEEMDEAIRRGAVARYLRAVGGLRR